MLKKTKDLGSYSCCYRESRNEKSIDSLLHGYAVSFKLVFEYDDPIDYYKEINSFSEIEKWLLENFNNTLIVAQDDPYIKILKQIDAHKGGYNNNGVCNLKIFDHIGVDSFALMLYNKAITALKLNKVKLTTVLVEELGGSKALYEKRDILNDN